MTKMMFRRAGLRMAMAVLCTGTMLALPMMAQDAAPSAPQGGGRAGRMQAAQLDMLTKKLNLTADQQTQIKAIDEDAMKQMMTLRNDTSLPQDDRRSKMMDIRKSSSDKIRAVLTDEQKPKYDELQAQMRDRMRERQQQGANAPQ